MDSTPEAPKRSDLGIYQDTAENVPLSRAPRHFVNMLSPRGADQPEWLPRPNRRRSQGCLLR